MKVYILKNAWLNITKNKGRNILIGIIIFIVTFSLTITLSIKNTASSLIKSYKDAYQVEATIGFNRGNMKEKFDFSNSDGMDKMKDDFSSIESITEDNIKSYADSKYVKSYYYTSTVSLDIDGLDKVSSDTNNDRPGRMEDDKFTLTGYSSIDSMSEFINGNYTISSISDDGIEAIFDTNGCLINEELATLNNISVGDTIVVSSVELKVIGIYTEKDDSFTMFTRGANTIITSTDVVNTLAGDEKVNVTPTFILTSYDDVDNFSSELTEKGLSEYYSANTNYDEVKSATNSISNVLSFSNMFLVLTLVIGAVVLLIINQINIRERKYEIGVLRTIGMKKRNLIFQFLAELGMVAFVFIIIGAMTGALLSKPISNHLLQNEIESSRETQEEVNDNFGGHMNNHKAPGTINVEEISSIDAVVDLKVVSELMVICFGILLVGSLTAIVSIQRFSPLEILKERS